MKTIFSLLSLVVLFAGCAGQVSNEPPASDWRFAQAWQAPRTLDASGVAFRGYEVCTLDPAALRVRTAGAAAPGLPCVEVAPGERVDLWVTPEAGPSPYHYSITVQGF